MTQSSLLALLVAICAFFGVGCKVGGGTALDGGLPVVLQVELVDAQGVPTGWAVYDGDTCVAKSSQSGRVRLVDKLSRITLAQLEFTPEHEMLVTSRTHDVRLHLAAGDPLPAWVPATRVFGPGEAEARGLTFAEATP